MKNDDFWERYDRRRNANRAVALCLLWLAALVVMAATL